MLDKRYGSGVSSLSPLCDCFYGAQCTQPEPGYSGPLLFVACSWSLTASYSTGPQIRNRWRAVAPQDFATPGTDRVRQEVATPGLQIPLERQYGDLTLASAQQCFRAFDIVAPKFLKIEALRAEYQNPLMGDQRK